MSIVSSIFGKCQFALKVQSLEITQKAFGSIWRYPDACNKKSCWPNRIPHLTHHKHQRHEVKPFEEGVFKQTRLRVIDNSMIGIIIKENIVLQANSVKVN